MEFFDAIDLGETIVTLASDHGNYLPAKATDAFTVFEQNNPLWLWVLPPGFATPTQRQTLLANEQELTTHTDTHYTLKRMISRLANANTLDSLPAELCSDPAMNQWCNLTHYTTRLGRAIPPWFVPGGTATYPLF